MTTTAYKSEAAAFGTRDDWSTWKGTEIGNRIVNFFNYKIYSVFGDSLPSTPSTSKIQAYFFSSTRTKRRSKQKGSLVSARNVTEDSDNTKGSDDTEDGDEIESGREISEKTKAQFADMVEFYSYSQPPITFNDYVKRLIHYTRMSISPVNLAVALFYIERIEKKGVCEVNQFTIFRLLAVAYLVAYKYMDDPPMMKNLEYCKIAGISLAELNRLEFSFLKAMDFELGIGDDVSVAQKITRILVPPKVSPEILIGIPSRLSSKTLLDVNRCTPDTVIIDVDQPEGQFESHGSTYEYFIEDDSEQEDVFDREAETGNYSSVHVHYHRTNSVTSDDKDNLNSELREYAGYHRS